MGLQPGTHQCPTPKGKVQSEDKDVLEEPHTHHPVQTLEATTKGGQAQIDGTLEKVVIANVVQQKHDQNNVEYVIDGAHVLHLQQCGQVRFARHKHLIGQLTTTLLLLLWIVWLLLLLLFLLLLLLCWSCLILDITWTIADVSRLRDLLRFAIMPSGARVAAPQLRIIEVAELVCTQLLLAHVLQHILNHAGESLLEVTQHVALEL